MSDTRNLRTHFRMRYAGAGENLQPVDFLGDTVIDGQFKSPKLPMKKLVPKTMNINGQQESRLYGAARYENLEFTAAALGESIWQLTRLLFTLVQLEYYDTVTGARVGQVVGRSKHTLRGMLEEVSPEAMDPTGDNAAPFMIHVTYEKQEVKLPTGNLTLINAPIIPVLELEPALYRTVINGVNLTEELAIALGYV